MTKQPPKAPAKTISKGKAKPKRKPRMVPPGSYRPEQAKNFGDKVNRDGRPSFVPRDEDRRVVRAAAGFGLRHDLIRLLVINPYGGKPIDKKTLEKHFEDELGIGQAQSHFNVGKSLYDQAVGVPQLDAKGKQVGWLLEPVASAGIWFSKAQMGWAERVKIDASDLKAIVEAFRGDVEALRAFRASIDPERSED